MPQTYDQEPALNTFGDYAKYYDLLYGEKNYSSEVDYIEALLKHYSGRSVHSILDIGCGTGRHVRLLAQRGYEVCGLDKSQEMIACARQSTPGELKLQYHICDATSFHLGMAFDAVVSLFHVFSYQTVEAAALSFLKNAYDHLHDDGLLIFDFWYGPAVLAQKPEARIKRLENSELRIIRIAEPVLHEKQNMVDVCYEVLIERKSKAVFETIKESHHMRYFFHPELESMLSKTGFRLVRSLEWLTMDRDVSTDSWSGTIIACKNKADTCPA